MKQWLEWRLGEFGPELTGKAKALYRGETPEDFLKALAGADPEALEAYQEPLYEVLISMAERNDAPSVRQLLTMVPGLDLRGYREGFTALGAAAVKGAMNAMDALWERGAGTELGVGLPYDHLAFCWQYDVPLEAVRRIFRHGAAVDAMDAVTLLRNDEYDLLRLALEEAKPEKICAGQGVAGLIAYMEDYIAQEEPDKEEAALLGQGMELLKEFL